MPALAVEGLWLAGRDFPRPGQWDEAKALAARRGLVVHGGTTKSAALTLSGPGELEPVARVVAECLPPEAFWLADHAVNNTLDPARELLSPEGIAARRARLREQRFHAGRVAPSPQLPRPARLLQHGGDRGDPTVPTPSGLAAALDFRALRRLAGDRSFERGEEYFAADRVRSLSEGKRVVTAEVDGTEPYSVKLWLGTGGLEYSCTCPMGDDGAFCKHCVAVGLAWVDRSSPAKGKARPRVTLDDVRAWLSDQEPAVLVDLIMDQAAEDARLREKLLLAAARSDPKGPDLATYRAALDAAIRVRGFVDYRSAAAYVRRIDAAVDGLEELLGDGHATAVIQLAEHALASVERALDSIDDSDGGMGEVLRHLREVHLAACLRAKPDPEELAKRLFVWELEGEWETFLGAAEGYADVLGEKGLAVYRQLAEAVWARLPARGPGDDRPSDFSRRFTITHIMETLARLTGDVETLVAVKQRDLSTEWSYLQIAEAYATARKHDKALEWAERGLEAFPERTDARLREFLAEEYHRRNRHDEALAQVWAQFEAAPHPDQYENLERHAKLVKAWPSWRAKALAHMRRAADTAAATDARSRRSWGRIEPRGRSDIVRVLLGEGDVEAAWQEAAAGGCSNDLWLSLAAKGERQHPEDALRIYKSQLDPILEGRSREAYRSAVELLRKVRVLMVRLGREADFVAYVDSVRAAHKPKRNLMKLLDREGWSAREARGD